MNLLEILNNNSDIILAEAVRINNGKEAYELIKSNKIGVKIHPSYNFDDSYENEFISILDQIIEKSSANDKVFIVQFFMNKIPMNQMFTLADKNYVFKAISYRNKPWAKDYPGYKEFISLNGKEITKDLSKLVKGLEDEAQKHGHGDKKEVKNLYDDGIWTLQVPLSFNGARAISYYGKKGEKQTPTGWCTRTDIFWYNKYSKESPLYIIRNLETGKAYQISFEEGKVNFLDEKDVKGDRITKGDLSEVPSKLLEFIKWKGKSLKDYKDMDMSLTKGKLTKGSSFRDATVELEKARWGKDIILPRNIIKNVWENYSKEEVSYNKLTDYMINNKTPGYVKHGGSWAAKYYFKDNPDYFMVYFINSNFFFNKYYFNIGNKIENVSQSDFIEKIGKSEQKLLLKIAKDDIGEKKNRSRKNNYRLEKTYTLEAEQTLNKHLSNGLSNILNKYLPGHNIKIKKLKINNYDGSFIPRKLLIGLFDKQNKEVGYLDVHKNDKMNYYIDCEFNNNYNIETTKFKKEIEQIMKKIIINYSKEMIKNKSGIKIRNYEKIINSKLNRVRGGHGNNPYIKTYFEDYFPY